jgi:hypothetical protein
MVKAAKFVTRYALAAWAYGVLPLIGRRGRTPFGKTVMRLFNWSTRGF